MEQFDRKKWIDNASKRFKRSPKSQSAIKKLKNDKKHIACLQKLVKWCKNKSIEVMFYASSTNKYEVEDRRISINKRLSPEKQVYVILHECGHVLVGDKENHERYGMGYSQFDPNVVRTLRHKCDVIDEEFEAWHRGWVLGKRLNLKLSKCDFDKTKSLSLKTYFVWITLKTK